MKFNIEKIRQQFPLIMDNPHCQHYLDSAATAQKPESVITKESAFYRYQNAAVHRGIHRLSSDATIDMEKARSTVAQFIGADCASEVIFTKGTTESINLIANSWGGSQLKAGDEIIISEMEHHANIVPWQLLASQKKLTIRVWPMESDGTLLISNLIKLINQDTRLLAITHVSNVLGSVNPIKEICQLARLHNIVTVVDGAQAIMHQQVNVDDLGCDFYTFSGHKLYAPTGVGVLWGKKSLLNEMPPWQGGGAMIQDVDFVSGSTWADIPTRFEAGTPHIAGIIGLAEAISFVKRVGLNNIAEHEQKLMSYALDELAQIPELVLYGSSHRTGVISFNLGDIHAFDVGSFLDKYSVAIRTGHHCALPIMKHYKVPAMCRASIAMYTSKSDIDALVDGLKRIHRLFQ